MGGTVTEGRSERRREPRIVAPKTGPRLAVRLTLGGQAHLLDLSRHGAGIETTRRLRPGSTVTLGESPGSRIGMVEATVVTCRVTSLANDAVTLRCGLRLAGATDRLRALASHHGYRLPKAGRR